MSALNQIKRYMSSNYGNLVSVGTPIFDEQHRIWKAQLKSDYPRIIQDDIDPQKRILRFITLKGLGEIKLSEDLKIIDATPRSKCVENLDSFLRIWVERAEKIIVSTSSNQLAKVNGAEWMLNPIVMILANLSQQDFISDWEIEEEQHQDHIKQYLKLLEELELVKQLDNGWTYGNLFTVLRDTSHNFEEFKISVLSHIIKERYSVIREFLNISAFETVVHVDTCYYIPSLEAEELLFKKESSITSDYKTLYGKKGPLRLRQILGELVTVGALKKKNGYYYGDEGIFNQMLDMKDQLEMVSSRIASS